MTSNQRNWNYSKYTMFTVKTIHAIDRLSTIFYTRVNITSSYFFKNQVFKKENKKKPNKSLNF